MPPLSENKGPHFGDYRPRGGRPDLAKVGRMFLREIMAKSWPITLLSGPNRGYGFPIADPISEMLPLWLTKGADGGSLSATSVRIGYPEMAMGGPRPHGILVKSPRIRYIAERPSARPIIADKDTLLLTPFST